MSRAKRTGDLVRRCHSRLVRVGISPHRSAAIRLSTSKPQTKDSDRSRRTDADSLSLTDSDSISRKRLHEANHERLTLSPIRRRVLSRKGLRLWFSLYDPGTTISSIPHERQKWWHGGHRMSRAKRTRELVRRCHSRLVRVGLFRLKNPPRSGPPS